MIDLRGETAVVTGGSRGIGRAVCLMLARAGADVIVGFHSDEAAAEHVVEQVRAMGRRAVAVAGDAARRATVERMLAAAAENFSPATIFVGNAGVWKRAPIGEMTIEQWNETLRVNLTSIYQLCHLAAGALTTAGGGRIVLISSTAGQRGEAFYSHYAASKGAIIALTKSLGAELGPSGIRVNAVAPGWVETDMATAVFSDTARAEQIVKQIPMGRIAVAEDIAGAVLFLVSDLAAHVQGEVINVNGGSVMCG